MVLNGIWKKYGGFFLVLVMIIINPVNTDAGQRKATIKVEKGNIRSEASLAAKINAQLKKGEAVIVLEKKNDWYHVQLSDGETGWAHKSVIVDPESYISDVMVPGKPANIKANVGNIRANPSLKAKIINRLRKGDPVTITDKKGDWYEVELIDGAKGWAHKILFMEKKPGKIYTIKGIKIEKAPNGEEKAYFAYNGPKPPRILFDFTIPEHPRIISIFPDTKADKSIKPETSLDYDFLKDVRIGFHHNNKTWVVFDMNPECSYELEHIFAPDKNLYIMIITGLNP